MARSAQSRDRGALGRARRGAPRHPRFPHVLNSMSWLDMLIAVLRGSSGAGSAAQKAASAARQAEWQKALKHDRLPEFVTARLHEAAAGKTPWIATMTPAELALARRRGVRPLAMVSGTCF